RMRHWEKRVAKADGYEQLEAVLPGQLQAEGLAKAGRAHPQIDDGVQHGTGDAANQLGHRRRQVLVVEAPKHALPRPGMIVLDELEIHPRLPVAVTVVRFQEKAALVGMHERLDA